MGRFDRERRSVEKAPPSNKRGADSARAKESAPKTRADSVDAGAFSSLQDCLGNRGATRLLRALASARASERAEGSIRLGAPGDASEREADRTAERAMNDEHAAAGDRRAAAATASLPRAPAIVDDVVKTSGQPLDPRARAFMKRRFGRSFDDVRVHTGPAASQSAEAVSARAFTVGSHIVFGDGEYAPSTDDGRRTLAHELAHVVQQSSGAPVVQRKQIHSGRILDEGGCQHLACNSRFACDDPQAAPCPDGTRNAGKPKKPLFTCDKTCAQAGGCSDSGAWMAIPHDDFAFRKCDQDLVICANGQSTHATVRDRSERGAFEVSPGIQASLGASGTFQGAIYSDEQDPTFKTDARCGNAPKK